MLLFIPPPINFDGDSQAIYYTCASILGLAGVLDLVFGKTRFGRWVHDHFKTVRRLMAERDAAQAAAQRAADSAKYATERADQIEATYRSVETRLSEIATDVLDLRLDLDRMTQRFRLALVALRQQVHYGDVLADMLRPLIGDEAMPARPVIQADLQADIDALPKTH